VVPGIDAQVNVTQEHNNLSRDGLYTDPAFTAAAAAGLMRDLNFDGTISGNVYAQPLYIEGGPNGPMIIAVTESNNVYALNATSGTVIWQRNLGPAVTSGLPCGNINPVGITGTPIVDLVSRSLFFDALIDGVTKQHFTYSLDVDTGATKPGWPVDVSATATYNGMTFSSLVQEERGGLALVNGIVYVTYSGYAGDCGNYHGWVVGIDINNPSNVHAWATTAIGGGIWGHGGVASDGTNMFVTTGNTFNTGGNWMGGEAMIRLQAGPIFTSQPTDYWAPTNWLSLDNSDTDLGGVSATVIDVPGAVPSQLVLALGKDSNAYLLNRNNLGGIMLPVTQANVGGINRGTSAVTYRTSQGTYFAFHNDENTIRAYRITATNPPTIAFAWSMSQTGRGSPWVTTTDGTDNVIVWVAGVAGDQRLHGYDGDTGAVVYAGGGVNELMTGTRQWNTGMVARGRIYFGADNKVYAFRLSAGTPTPSPTATATATSTPTATATATATSTPTPTVQVVVQASPAGLAFSVDGTSYTSPQTFSWVRGSSHTIATTSPQSGGTGTQYVWRNWSDGGAISHTVAPTKNKIYTANFNTQYFLTMDHGIGGTVNPPSGWKNSGVTVSITARPARDYSFNSWAGTGTGSYSGSNNPASITMSGPITETATFTHN
jgi:outer membrane protein assembly factor BamB